MITRKRRKVEALRSERSRGLTALTLLFFLLLMSFPVVSGDAAQSMREIATEILTDDLDLDVLSVYNAPEGEGEADLELTEKERSIS